jgi:predicted ATP-dependent endonuclease of OLD family
MRLVAAQVTDFRSIDDSGRVALNDVTCLVGKNEAGKTNFLVALERLNPADGRSGAFDLTTDFPRKRLNQFERSHKDGDLLPVVIAAEYQLSDAEKAEIAKTLGDGAITSKTIAREKRYDNSVTWRFASDDGVVIKHITEASSLTGDLRARAQDAASIAKLTEILSAHSEEPGVAELQAQITSWPHQSYRSLIAQWLDAWQPLYLYFGDYSLMPGRVSVADLTQKQAAGTLSRQELTFMSLLEHAGTGLDQYSSEADYERSKARLEAAGLEISDELFKFWKQNRDSEIEFDKSGADPTAAAPLNEGINLHVRVKSRRHGVSVPVDQRSHGFVWFFSFLVYFTQISSKHQDRPLVLLLDEPGMALHALAQADFLEVIDERLAPRYQVVYTTHSPFMVDSSRLERVRLVEDTAEHGTQISSDVYGVTKDTVFPIQAALGYEIGQTLFVAPNTLLVEGPSDLIYLSLLSRAVERRKGSGIDRRWAVTPVGGVRKMAAFVSLFGANQLNTCLLIDVSSSEKQVVTNLVSGGGLDEKNVVQMSEFVDAKDADIEDLFDPEFYLELVKGAYPGTQAAALTAEMIKAGNPRIVKRIETTLESFGMTQFSHLEPARYFEREEATLLDQLSSGTLDRAQALFDRVNELLK